MPDLDRVSAGLRCRDLLSLLPDFVGAELSAKEIERVTGHVKGCVDCEKFGTEYGLLVGALHERLDPPPMTSGIKARLARRMEAMWAREDT